VHPNKPKQEDFIDSIENDIATSSSALIKDSEWIFVFVFTLLLSHSYR